MSRKILSLIAITTLLGIAGLVMATKASEASAAAATVTLTNFMFTPKTVRIKAGETVTWTSKEGSHTVKADNGSFASGTISSGQSYSFKFDKPGTYKYYCSFHGSAGGHDMAGTVVVRK